MDTIDFLGRDYQYFTRVQIWQHHTGHGSTTEMNTIAVYSFALKPEEHQPSGTYVISLESIMHN